MRGTSNTLRSLCLRKARNSRVEAHVRSPAKLVIQAYHLSLKVRFYPVYLANWRELD